MIIFTKACDVRPPESGESSEFKGSEKIPNIAPSDFGGELKALTLSYKLMVCLYVHLLQFIIIITLKKFETEFRSSI